MTSSVRAGQSRRTNRPSRLYDSRRTAAAGIGFPSCSTALERYSPNPEGHDPHGYYREIGVSPTASAEEIRARVRVLYRRYHPDTGVRPDTERFQRVRNIAKVLLDSVERVKYDNTPEGMRLMDAVFADELSKLPPEDLEGWVTVDSLRPDWLKPPKPLKITPRFDYFAVEHRPGDSLIAQQWYHYLMSVALESPHRGRLRVMLFDGAKPYWSADAEILMVPRAWESSEFAARHLMRHIVG